MKQTKEWFECDYCGTNVDGTTNIWDDFINDNETVDICNNPKCLKKHIKTVKEKILENNNFLYWILDNLSDEHLYEYEFKLDKFKMKIKWNENDKWHIYTKKTVVDKIMPFYIRDYLKLNVDERSR